MSYFKIAYFDQITGLVASFVTINNIDGAPDPRSDEFAVLTDYSGGLPAYWDGEKILAAPTQPSAEHVWDSVGKKWTLDLIGSKNNLLKQIMAERDAIEFGPFTYNGMVFDGDLHAQRRLSILVSAAKSSVAAGFSFTKDFTLADNSVVQLTAEDFIGIEMAKLLQVDAAFQEHRQKKAAIEAATTLEELEAI